VAIWSFEPSQPVPCTAAAKVKRRRRVRRRVKFTHLEVPQPRRQGVVGGFVAPLPTSCRESSRHLVHVDFVHGPISPLLIDGPFVAVIVQPETASPSGQLAAHHQVGHTSQITRLAIYSSEVMSLMS